MPNLRINGTADYTRLPGEKEQAPAKRRASPSRSEVGALSPRQTTGAAASVTVYRTGIEILPTSNLLKIQFKDDGIKNLCTAAPIRPGSAFISLGKTTTVTKTAADRGNAQAPEGMKTKTRQWTFEVAGRVLFQSKLDIGQAKPRKGKPGILKSFLSKGIGKA